MEKTRIMLFSNAWYVSAGDVSYVPVRWIKIHPGEVRCVWEDPPTWEVEGRPINVFCRDGKMGIEIGKGRGDGDELKKLINK